jgi:hypothetical protein
MLAGNLMMALNRAAALGGCSRQNQDVLSVVKACCTCKLRVRKRDRER